MMAQVFEAVSEAAKRTLPVELRGQEPAGGHTRFEVVGERGPVKVLYYAPSGERVLKTPVVLAYSLINRYYILDFLPGRSLIEYLTSQGHPCYVIDWGTPGIAERHKTYADYAVGYIGFAVKTAMAREGVDQVHLYGYCMGGTMALAYAALKPENVKSFVAMAVPVDFHDGGLLSTWTTEKFFNVDALVDAWGNVPTWLMESGFRFLAPLGNVTKWRDLWENRDKDGFVETWRAMERWSSDNVPFPGEVYRQYIRDCYQRNAFCKNEMVLDGQTVDLRRVTCPTLMVLAKNDHIVPRPSAMALKDLVGATDVTVQELPTGHIGISTSSKAAKSFWPPVSQWLAERD